MRYTSAKSAENLFAKLTVLIIVATKGKFDPTKSKSTATFRAPKPISKLSTYPSRNMLYVVAYQTEAVCLLTENIEFENKNVPTLFRMD